MFFCFYHHLRIFQTCLRGTHYVFLTNLRNLSWRLCERQLRGICWAPWAPGGIAETIQHNLTQLRHKPAQLPRHSTTPAATSTIRHNPAQPSTMQHNSAQPSTSKHNLAQPSTTQQISRAASTHYICRATSPRLVTSHLMRLKLLYFEI